ncbi:MFS transporter [Acuticoccus sediminis]|uniref:MFS transporter n=1 Tax=Acuticoccus sediminis TaxID=2184697 RepID=UPI001CFF1D79|nr:MFS transporter [Acuticoccus sediminis]
MTPRTLPVERAAGPSAPLVAAIAFLTLVDLFAAQAIVSMLTSHYGVTPAEMGVAVNAATIGMAIASLAVALFSARLDRRLGIAASLLLLSVPTALLAFAPDLATFSALRVTQGLCMAVAFTLTLAWLGERAAAAASAGAFAAYVTGNVGSNLLGRLLAAGIADHFGVGTVFFTFAALNLCGAALAFAVVDPGRPAAAPGGGPAAPWAAVFAHLANPALVAAFLLGFSILFAFIGVFTYVNFVLVAPPLGLGMMALGTVYFVFAPSMVTTPLAGRIAARVGVRAAVLLGLAVAMAGALCLLSASLAMVLAGMTLVGLGTFFAQGVATGFVGRAATHDRSAASGLYLASYFAGGLVGASVLGQVFDRLGWSATVLGVCIALAAGMACAARLTLRARGAAGPQDGAIGSPAR